MKTRSAYDSEVECTHLVMPPDTNNMGNCFGGRLLSWMDIAAGVSAYRHCGRPAVTVAIDEIHFSEAVHLGDIVVIKSQVDFVGKTSMEVSVSVDVDDVKNRVHKHCLDGYFTFVALDDNGKPIEVEGICPQTDVQLRRYDAAEARKANRPKRIK